MTERYKSIDSLRGLAAMLVVWLHVCEVFASVPGIAQHGIALHSISSDLGFGRIGIVAFFAISGYVICPTISGPTIQGSSVFLIKRIFRLLPAFWFAMLACWFASWYLRGIPIEASTVLSNATMLPSLLGEPFIQGHFWTLEIELVFYGAVIILFVLGIHQNPLALLILSGVGVLILAATTLQFIPKTESHWSFASYHLAIMFWGALIRIWQSGRQPMVRFFSFPVGIKYLVGLATLCVFSPLFYSLLKWFLTSDAEKLNATASFAFGMMLFLVFAFAKNLHSKLMVWLGKISYSVYLLHPAVFYTFFYLVKQYPEHPLANLHMGVYLVVTVILVCLLSEVVYRVIENPANQLARRITSKTRMPAPNAKAASRA